MDSKKEGQNETSGHKSKKRQQVLGKKATCGLQLIARLIKLIR